jgi:hypothetical protein
MPRHHRQRPLLVYPRPANDDRRSDRRRDIGTTLVGVLLGLAATVALVLALSSWMV